MIFLAHGLLGPFDEIIFLVVATLFMVMMGISWFRSRDDFEPDEGENAETPAEPSTDETHFQLK